MRALEHVSGSQSGLGRARAAAGAPGQAEHELAGRHAQVQVLLHAAPRQRQRAVGACHAAAPDLRAPCCTSRGTAARAAACCLATACTRMSSEMMQHIQTLLIMT